MCALLLPSDGKAKVAFFRYAGLVLFAICVTALDWARADTLQLNVPASVVEGDGVLANAGRINLGGVAVSNVVVALQSTDPGSLVTPPSVTVLAGQSNALFDVTVPDNLVAESNRLVTVTATAPGWATASNTVTVIDNDPVRIRFGPVNWLADTNTAFGVLLTAENADGSIQTNFHLSLTLVAEGLEGVLPLSPTNTGDFVAGQRYVGVQVTALGHAVRLRCLEYPGQSDGFNVTPPMFTGLAQPVADIAWHAASQTLFASVPASGGPYSNSLVAIDPATGLVTNAYPVGASPGEIELSADGSFLYVAISNSTALQRFDLNTRTAGLSFVLSTNTNPVRFASDFCVAPGLPDAVVVAARDRDYLGNISAAGFWRYSSGVAVSLPNFNANGGWLVDSLTTGFDVLLAPALARGNASSGAILVQNTNILGNADSYHDGQVYDDRGNFYSASSLALLGNYPNVIEQLNYTSLPEVNSALRRVYYLAGYFNYGVCFYKLKAYDRDLYQPLFAASIPTTYGAPTRFIRCGTNLLAYVTSNGLLWFIGPEAVQPQDPAADLSLTMSGLPPVAVVGTDYSFSLCLSNAGPGVASLVRVTNALPANVTVVQTIPSAGSVTLASSAFTWNVAGLPAGSNATLQLTLHFNSGGWQTNTAWALGFEADPNYTNNVVTLPLYVQLSPIAAGAFSVNYSAEDLFYDSARDRLLLSVANGLAGGQSNGLASFNPHTGVVESFTSLGKKPARLAGSDDGQALYVSLPDNSLVRRLTLPALTSSLDIGLGAAQTGSGDWLSLYAADLAVVPGAANSIAVWRKNLPHVGYAGSGGFGIAVYDNATLRSNVTPVGGAFTLQFGPDSNTLYVFNAVADYWTGGHKQGLYRCDLSASGAAISGSLLPDYSFPGQDARYALGRMFTTSGRVAQVQPPMVEWFFPGAENASLVTGDASLGRVFYLTQNNGWWIRAYDIQRKVFLGSISVPNVFGTPSSLIRCGTNALAFRTSGNQVFIVRTPLAQPNAAADLAIQIEGPDAPVTVGSEALLILSLTNRGPLSAADVTVTNSYSSNASVDWTFCTDGSIQVANGRVVWNLPGLDAGKDSFAAVVIRPLQTGVVSVAADVKASSLDLHPSDNSAFLALQVDGSPGLDKLVTLALPVQDLAWSPSLGRLLATTSTSNLLNWSGALLTIDPVMLGVRFESALGADAERLARSRDDSVLYAGVDYGVTTLTLPDLVMTNRFLVNASDANSYAYDMEVVPNADQSLVIGSRSRSSNSTWLGVYDGSVPRTNAPNFYASGFSLEFGDDPALFYYQDYGYGGFSRYTINAQGVSLLDNAALLPTAKPIALKWADGLLYTSLGIVIDPVLRQPVRTIPGITNNSALCYDTATKRVFYLMPVGSNALLHAVDGPTGVSLGTRLLSGFSGASAGLVRWGTNGLAFRTTSGQVALLNSSLVPADPPADLALGLTAADALAFVGSNFVYSVMVTNLGSTAAANAQIALRVPTNVSVTAAASSQGAAVTGPQQALATLGTLLPGGMAQLTVTVVASQPGRIQAVASVTSSALDPDWTNNSRSLTNPVVLFVARDGIAVLNQAAADLVFNPVTGRLYASGNASYVAVINPALAQVEANWSVPTQPGRMALSGDGQALYVSHDSGRQLARLGTLDGGVVTNFALGTNSSGAAYSLLDLEVIPGTAGSVVVNEQASGYRYLAVMDDGVARPNVPQLPYPSNGSFLEFGDDPSVVYLSGLMPMLISSNGITVVGGNNVFSTSSNFKYDSRLFYTDAGQQVDPANQIASTRFTGLGTGTLVATDIPRRRIYFLSRIGSGWQLRAYDPVTADLVGSLAITNVEGTPSALVRWGDDGLAFCTTSSQIFLLRPWFVPGGPDADLQLTQTPVPPGPVNVGSNVTFVVQITNAGPTPAASVVLLDRLPTNTTVVQAQMSQGTTNLSGGLLAFNLGTITNGGSAQISLTLRPQRAGALANRVTVTSANPDPDQSNNTVITSVGVQLNLPSDAAGVVGLQTADIEYDPISGLIYASLTNYLGAPYENAVVPIDPATGLVGNPISVAPGLSQEAIADDGSYLYVLANNAAEFRRVHLPDGTVDLRVLAGASQIKTVPGQPRSLALVPNPTGVVVYDDAVPRPVSLSWYDHIEFFATNLLVGFWGNMVPNWTARLVLSTNGVAVNSGQADYLVDGTMKADAGLIYTSAGSIIDPMILTRIHSINASGPVAPDHTVKRVFFLTGSGPTLVLRAFDSESLLELGSLAVTNVAGTANKLIRCGADRLAFRTSGGQVFILRTSQVPGGPPADLGLTQSANPDPVLVGSNLLYTLTVTNNGPNAATNVSITDTLPPSAQFVSVSATSGTVSNYGSAVTCRLDSLASGGSVSVSIVVTPGLLTTLTNVASVASSSTDPALANNSSTLTTAVAYLAGPNSTKEIELSARDMVYDPVSRRIYASGAGLLGGAGSSIFPINPENGVIEAPIWVGDNPGKVAVSDDGHYLHAGLNGASAIRRVDLFTRTADLQFSIGTNVDVEDMVALPGSPTAIAVARMWTQGTPIHAGVVIFDSGSPRPNQTPGHTGSNVIEPGADGSVLYGYRNEDTESGFRRMAVDANGVTITDVTLGLIATYTADIHYRAGRIYTTSGQVIDPVALSAIGTFSNIPPYSLVTTDPTGQLAFYLCQEGSAWALRCYSTATFTLQSSLTITNVVGTPASLMPCGADRLAFLTSGGQVFVIRDSAIPSADLVLSGSLATNQVMVDETLDLQLTVSNAGPYAATGVTLSNTLPPGINLVSASFPQGFLTTNDQAVTLLLDSLATNASVTLTLTLTPAAQALGLATNTAEVAAASPPDAVLFNNHLSIGLVVMPKDSDHDGMPDDWEIAHGLNPTNAADAALDSDGDGRTNLQEYRDGTDPFVFDGLRVVATRINERGLFELTVHAAIGKTYTVEASTNLTVWTSVASFLCQEDNQAVMVPMPLSAPACFFRLQSSTNAPLPVLKLLDAQAPPAMTPQLRISAPPGWRYSLQTSTDLANWSEVTNYYATAYTTVITDPVAAGFNSRFYRVMRQ